MNAFTHPDIRSKIANPEVVNATAPIALAEALAMVAGKTEKPGGVDPLHMLHAGNNPYKELRYGHVPLSLFVANEDGERYDGTVDAARAADYASRDGAAVPPVLATQGRLGNQLRINDGGHRISAARMRGDQTIRAIVSIWTGRALPAPALR